MLKGEHRGRIALAAGLMTIILGLAACGGGGVEPAASPSAEEMKTGGTVRVASNAEMPGFDPVRLGNVGSGIERAAQVLDTLFYRNEQTDEVLPQLAKGISTDDALVWVMELREGVTFTDGTPLDAEAVIFNLERHIAADSKSTAKALLSGLASMEATGEYEVTFTLSAPSGSFPLVLTASSPASLIGSPAALADPEKFNAEPVGAGPFKLESWVRDATLTLVKNEDYWNEGLPYLDSLEFRIMPDDQSRADALLSGGMEMVQLASGATWNAASSAPGTTVLPLKTGGQALIPNASRAPGDDVRIREAMAIAFDPDTTVKVLLGGTTASGKDVACVPFTMESPACEPSPFTQDLDKAKDLVADYVADGGDPTLELVYWQSLSDHATYIQQQLAEVGITLTLRGVDFAGLAESQSTGNYGAFWGGTASTAFPTVWNRYYSGGTNWGMVTYPELDEALLEARDAVELDDRNAAWRDASAIVQENFMLNWILPFPGAMAFPETLHIGTEDRPYTGSTMIYYDTASLSTK